MEQSADAIREAFAEYEASFEEITCKAKRRFELCEWLLLQADSEERLDLYKNVVDKTVDRMKQELGAQGGDGDFWAAVKQSYTLLIADRDDFDLAESFYNSVTMRMVASRGIEPGIEYMGTEFPAPAMPDQEQVYTTYPAEAGTPALVRRLLDDYRFEADYRDIEQTVAHVAAEIDANLTGRKIELTDIAKPVFYRGKAAYLVGRILTGGGHTPFVLALMNDEQGIDVDAVLMTEDEVSIIFSFARSYFHVEVKKPYALVHFLKAIMPLKPIAELYISLGYNKHGKTELYRDLRRHLAVSTDRFEIARGERGMVMVVFTLPSYDVVFKVIKDSFDYPKVTTRREVQNHYQLVFKHDRGGRLVDAQEFEHLRFDRDRFSPALLEELLRVAANSVVVEGDTVEIKHLYTERRLTPLNLYLREVGPEQAEAAVIDYGQTIKDLAATNIFPGDILLKNFGVTRHGRVVFYDYDELCLLTDCNFREMPTTQDADEAVSSEPWFFVGENDVFPEELATFLGLPPPLRAVFTESNSDLFGVPFWTDLQARHRAGEVLDIFPYKESRRLDKEVRV
ncbi:MAG: bifunctional isocitrate dehydrogenase kinase/phosphatase [Chloroflexia bacterium]